MIIIKYLFNEGYTVRNITNEMKLICHVAFK